MCWWFWINYVFLTPHQFEALLTPVFPSGACVTCYRSIELSVFKPKSTWTSPAHISERARFRYRIQNCPIILNKRHWLLFSSNTLARNQCYGHFFVVFFCCCLHFLVSIFMLMDPNTTLISFWRRSRIWREKTGQLNVKRINDVLILLLNRSRMDGGTV